MTLLDYLGQRANEALKNHTRMVLLLVLNLLYQCETKDEAVEKIASFLDNY